MSHVSLMVQLELGRSNRAPLGVARDLAARLKVSVTGIARAQPIQVLMGAEFVGEEIIREDEALIERQAAAAEAEFHAAMDGHGMATRWSMATTFWSLSDQIAEAAGPADLLVVGIAQTGEEFSNSTRRVDAEDLIMQIGRPVLLVPLGIERFQFGCALVAWNNGREARRALTDALPLLRLMKKVVIAEIADDLDPERSRADLDRMVDWLAWQGVAALPRLAPAAGEDGDRLLALGAEEGAELIVAGAYGHSRFREWVLGGVTRTLLHQAGCCVLMSH